MNLINEITNDARQKHTLVLPSGNKFVMQLEYRSLQTGWFMALDYGTFSIRNFRLFSSPDMLFQFRNLIPFGMACFVDADQEPLFQDDFSSGRAKLFQISDAEVEDFEKFLSGD